MDSKVNAVKFPIPKINNVPKIILFLEANLIPSVIPDKCTVFFKSNLGIFNNRSKLNIFIIANNI